MVGRRGPAQAAFTTPELHRARRARGRGRDRRSRRSRGRGADRHELRAEPRGPARVRGARAGGQAEAARAALPALAGRAPRRRARRGRSSSCATGSRRTRAARCAPCRPARPRRSTCGIVFRSVGYRGVALPGVPFDEATRHDPERARPRRPGVYVAGWIKRGPSGVIGTNKKDAAETVELLLEDLRDAPRKDRPRGGDRPRCSSSAAFARSSTPGWTSIDELERAAGEQLGRPRVKLSPGTSCSTPRSRVAEARQLHSSMTKTEDAAALGRRDHEGGRATSPSPASRFRRRSRAGSAASRAPLRRRTPTSACSTATRRTASPQRPRASRTASSTTSSRSTSSRPAPAPRRT